MKNDLVAIYNTLKLLQMPVIPENTKYLAGIYIALERVISNAEKMEKEQNENEQAQGENGGD